MTNTSFAQMKKNRKSNFEKLNAELAKASTSKVEYKKDDDRFWYPNVDKVGNGYAVIRFLPAPEGEGVPFVRLFSHGFQGQSGSWYIENSLTTLGLPDPVSEYNSKLWNTGVEADKETARKQKRKLSYYSNIYVVKDGANPENEGKVFLYRYGKKIFDKLYEAANPPTDEKGNLIDPDVAAIDPFDLWEGANLKLKIRNVAGFRNYDQSSFEKAGPLLKDDKKMEAVYKEAHPLQPFVAPTEFKSYDELKVKLHRVLALGEDLNDGPQLGGNESNVGWKSPPTQQKAKAPRQEPELEAEIEGDDDDLSFFKHIADDDEESLVA